MIERNIKFDQKRSFTQVLTAAFHFLIANWKKMFSLFALYGIPVVIIISLVTLNMETGYAVTSPLSSMQTFVNILLFGFLSILFQAIIYAFMQEHINKEGEELLLSNIHKRMWKLFFPFFGYYLLLGAVYLVFVLLILVFAALSSVISGIFILTFIVFFIAFIIKFSLVFSSYAFSDVGWSGSFSRSSTLIKNNWWKTFGFGFIIQYISSTPLIYFLIVVSIVSVILQNEGFYLTNDSDYLLFFYFLYFLFVSLSTAIAIIILNTALGFQYFNLVERKEEPKVQAKIEKLILNVGNNDDQN